MHMHSYIHPYIHTYIHTSIHTWCHDSIYTFSSGHNAHLFDKIIIVRRLACTYFWETVSAMAIKKKANVACGCVRRANFLSLTRSTSVLVKYECHLNATPMWESRPIVFKQNIQKGPNSRFAVKRWWWVFSMIK